MDNSAKEAKPALVKIVGPVETPVKSLDALSIKKNGIPDGRRSGAPDPESGEVKLALANTMHQLDD